MDDEKWGVLVNQTAAFATHGGGAWWAQLWVNHSTRDNWTEFEGGAMGGWSHVAFPSRDDAESAREHMISNGLPGSQLKVCTLASARKTIATKTGAAA